MWWHLREALDPGSKYELAIPKDEQLKIELCSPRYRLVGGKIAVESKLDVIDRIGSRCQPVGVMETGQAFEIKFNGSSFCWVWLE